MDKKQEISNRAAQAHGLPRCEAVAAISDDAVAGKYGIVCEAISSFLDGKALRKYIAERLPQAIGAIRQQDGPWPAQALDDRTSASSWLAALKQSGLVSEASVQQTQTKAQSRASAPSLLRFLADLARASDLSAWANAKSTETATLEDIEHGQALNPQPGERRLIFCTQSRAAEEDKPWKPLFAVSLPQGEPTAEQPIDPQMVIHTQAFYDEGDAIRGGISAKGLESWLSQSWPDQALLSVAAFVQALRARTQEFLGVALQDLPGALGDSSAAPLQVRVATEAEAQLNPHADLLTQALVNPQAKPLLNSVCLRLQSGARADTVLSLAGSLEQLAQFRGHMDTEAKEGNRSEAFPLDPSQRLAACAAAGSVHRRAPSLLPVNGPPGSGKTSFLRAVLASMWVDSALAKAKHPAVVYGTGATNKAVANIIEAFGSVPGSVEGKPAYRWIDDLPSYGWFYPSQEAALARQDLMQLVWANKNPVTPAARAAALADEGVQALQTRKATLLQRARAALNRPHDNLTVETVVDLAHGRLKSLADEMASAQTNAREALDKARENWADRRTCRAEIDLLQRRHEDFVLEAKTASSHFERLQEAEEVTTLYLKEARYLSSGWRALFPWLRERLCARRLQDCQSLRKRAAVLAEDVRIALPQELAAVDEALAMMRRLQADAQALAERASRDAQEIDHQRNECQKVLDEHASSLAAALRACALLPGETQEQARFRTLRALRQWQSAPNSARGAWAHEQLVQRCEAAFDSAWRVPMFHWAARYWEARWLQDSLAQKAAISDKVRIERLMMLGVIIVATTYKVVGLGQRREADLLVMDEAGQCTPEVAAALLAITRHAVFVGDIEQLQPISPLSSGAIDAIARKAAPGEQVPPAVRPDAGSGMHLARAAAVASSQAGPHLEAEPGVLLRYHYRCLPAIIGYCNELMYGGRIVNARLRPSTVAWMPAMSWVDIDAQPQRDGSSWRNEAQANAIVEWIARHYEQLTQAGAIALAQVVAVITPLAAQAKLLRTLLPRRLGENAVRDMVIGTVHALQGAEKPVVLFSLVQSLQNGTSLMADRDGGHLMNVAVSRAQDAFVVFADRETLRPAPRDADRPGASGPVAALGRYLRRRGTRLYPNALVVVEAPGKVAAIAQILGPDVKVVATGGHLRESQLKPDGELVWNDLVGNDYKTQSAWRKEVAREPGLVQDLVIATDDDFAGELIGMHAAQYVSEQFAGQSVRIRRMRFGAVTPGVIQQSYRAAGEQFDADMLAAALLREFQRHVDRIIFQRALPGTPYAGARQRDALAWLKARCAEQGVGVLYEVHGNTHPVDGVDLAEQGERLRVFVPADGGALSAPLRLAKPQADAMVKHVQQTVVGVLPSPTQRMVLQRPAPYPANTTARVLALCTDELGLPVTKAQEVLNGLYQEGARAITN